MTPYRCEWWTVFWPSQGLLLYLLIVTLAREWKLEGFWNDAILVFALGFSFMPEVARLARSIALVESRKEYVEASHIAGERSLFIALGEILPNCVSPLIVNATVRLGYMILIIAALSFLGLGTPPPTPDWGADLSAARDHMETHPYDRCVSRLGDLLFRPRLQPIWRWPTRHPGPAFSGSVGCLAGRSQPGQASHTTITAP